MDSLLDDELPEEEEFTFNNQLSQKKEDTKELVALKTEISSTSTSEVTHNTFGNTSTSDTQSAVFMKKEVTNIQLDENYDD